MNLFETDILYICAYITCQICLIYENVYLIIKGIIRTLINDNTMSMSNQKEIYLWAIHLCYKKKKSVTTLNLSVGNPHKNIVIINTIINKNKL